MLKLFFIYLISQMHFIRFSPPPLLLSATRRPTCNNSKLAKRALMLLRSRWDDPAAAATNDKKGKTIQQFAFSASTKPEESARRYGKKRVQFDSRFPGGRKMWKIIHFVRFLSQNANWVWMIAKASFVLSGKILSLPDFFRREHSKKGVQVNNSKTLIVVRFTNNFWFRHTVNSTPLRVKCAAVREKRVPGQVEAGNGNFQVHSWP